MMSQLWLDILYYLMIAWFPIFCAFSLYMMIEDELENDYDSDDGDAE